MPQARGPIGRVLHQRRYDEVALRVRIPTVYALENRENMK